MGVRKFDYLLAAYLLLVSSTFTQAASVYRDSYQPVPKEEDIDNIEDNLIENDYSGVEGLFPPKDTAKDYYHSKYDAVLPPTESSTPTYNNKYVIDTVDKVLRLNQEDATAETKLSKTEEDEIKKMSAAFLDLFTNAKLENIDWSSLTTVPETSTEEESAVVQGDGYWKTLNPIITFSDSGLSIRFSNDTTPENNSTEPAVEGSEAKAADEDSTETPEDELRESLWTYLSDSIDKLLTEELEKVVNSTEPEGESTARYVTYINTDEPKEEESTTEGLGKEDQTAVSKFVDSVWNLMKVSVEYVGALFSGGNNKKEEGATAAPSSTTPSSSNPSTTESLTTEAQARASSASTFFAYEEPASYHRLPSQEFEKRGRDIDSLLYGHGIV